MTRVKQPIIYSCVAAHDGDDRGPQDRVRFSCSDRLDDRAVGGAKFKFRVAYSPHNPYCSTRALFQSCLTAERDYMISHEDTLEWLLDGER